MTPVATALVVIALAWLVRAMPDILAWCRALAAAIHWGSDPVAFCQAQRQRGRGWFRIAPGSMGGRPSYVVHDPALIASLYAAGNAVISWKTAHYFDYGCVKRPLDGTELTRTGSVFGLSRAWLKRPEVRLHRRARCSQRAQRRAVLSECAMTDALRPCIELLAVNADLLYEVVSNHALVRAAQLL
jgi:hypothetical protein